MRAGTRARGIAVLQFSNALARGGVEEYVLTLLRRLDRSLFRLHLVCPPAVAELLAPDLPADVELLPLLLRSPRHGAAALTLARWLRQRGIGILHAHQFYSSLFAAPIAWACRVPVIVETPHIREYWRGGAKARYGIDRLAGRLVDRYVAVSAANARYLVTEKGLPARKIVTIPFGCDLARFGTRRAAPRGLKASLGFGESDLVMAVVARLEHQKGHAVLLEALRLAQGAVPHLRLICVGEGSLRQSLQTQAAELGLTASVRFVGYQANIPEWLALADFCVLPSYFEGLPLTAIESLAAGRAVVATAVDGTPEVVVDGQTGLLVPPGDASALAAALCRLASDAALRQRLAETGRTWALTRFSQDRFIRDMEEFYLEAWRCAGGEAPRALTAGAA